MSNNNIHPIWTPQDSIDTAQAFHAEQLYAQRGRPDRRVPVLFKESRENRARLMDGLAVALLIMLMAALGVVVFASTAKADTELDPEAIAYAAHYASAVCSTLDDYPSVAGLTGILQAVTEDGLSSAQAGQAVGLSITESCPRYGYIIDLFIDRNGGNSVIA